MDKKVLGIIFISIIAIASVVDLAFWTLIVALAGIEGFQLAYVIRDFVCLAMYFVSMMLVEHDKE